jgi:hypothetical protein
MNNQKRLHSAVTERQKKSQNFSGQGLLCTFKAFLIIEPDNRKILKQTHDNKISNCINERDTSILQSGQRE